MTDTTEQRVVDYRTDGAVALIRLNRPERRNALNRALVRQLNAAIAEFNADARLRIAVIMSSGNTFSAGVDLKDLEALRQEPGITQLGDCAPYFAVDFEEVELNEKPLIAALHGNCYGAGLTFAMACDLRIASDDAAFCLPEARAGFPSVTGNLRCVRNMGMSNALELLLLAEPRDAAWALRTGLVNKVVSRDELEPAALGWARTIASMSADAISGSRKIAVAAASGLGFQDICRLGSGLRQSSSLDSSYVASIVGRGRKS